MAAMLHSHSFKNIAMPSCIEAIDITFSEDRWHVYTFGPCAVYMKQVSYNTNRPDLFVVTGISADSMISTSRIIMRQLSTLEKKYHRIFIIKFCHSNNYIDDMHKKACEQRDEKKLDEKIIEFPAKSASELPKKRWVSNRSEVYKPELEFYNLMAKLVNHIITQELMLTNVEVLGKSAGGCIAIDLVGMSIVYNALYLASPASPMNVIKLTELGFAKRQTMRFHFGWPVNDMYLLKWNIVSRDDKSNYDIMMEKLNIVNYKSRIYDMIEINNGHELHPDMITDICLY